MTENELAVFEPQYADGLIRFDMDAARSRLASIMQPYEGLDEEGVKAISLKDAKADRAYLNKIIKSVKAGRTAVKRQYMAPFDAFSKDVDELLAGAEATVALIDSHAKELERIRRETIWAELEAHYDELLACNGLDALAQNVPFSTIREKRPKWGNVSYGIDQAKREMDALSDSLMTGFKTLAEAELYDPKAAIARFFDTFDLQAALAADTEARRRAASMEALAAQVQENTGVNYLQPEPEPAPAPEPEPELRTIQLDQYPTKLMQNTEEEAAEVYVLAIEATRSQKGQLLAALSRMGIHGKVTRANGHTHYEDAFNAVKEVLR